MMDDKVKVAENDKCIFYEDDESKMYESELHSFNSDGILLDMYYVWRGEFKGRSHEPFYVIVDKKTLQFITDIRLDDFEMKKMILAERERAKNDIMNMARARA